jgi:peptidyl-prolyl cis-trans isomerase C
MKRLFTTLILLGLAPLLASCGSKSDSDGGLPAGEIAAKVNGEAIPLSDVTRVAKNFKQQGIPTDPNSQGATPEEQLYYTVIDRLVEQNLILQDATSQNISVTEEEVQATMSQFQVNVGGPDAFAQALAQAGATMEDFEKDMRINLIMQKYMDEVVNPTITVPDEEIQAYFETNPDQFAAQPELHGRHILFRMDPGADELTKAGMRQKAEAALARAEQGEDFEALAREVSEDETTGPGGGDLGWFGQGRMVPPFDTAAFALSPGEISGLVETQFGLHIIKIEEARMTEAKNLEDVREPVRRFLAQGKLQEGFQDAVARLRGTAEIEINPPEAEILTELAS